ncbi:MAG: nucleoside deaminase [Burkholderiales bacterium]|nr:nucleoside deaminase [Burkholderiales bacterium]
MELDHDHFMGIALDLARATAAAGNRPVGSVLVAADGTLLASGANRIFTDFDSTAHAEMFVIREGGQKLRTLDLSGCTLYSSLEPCPMCCWATIQANVSCLVLGGRHAALGSPGLGRYSVETMLEFTGRRMALVTGIRAQECEQLRRAWNAERARR